MNIMVLKQQLALLKMLETAIGNIKQINAEESYTQGYNNAANDAVDTVRTFVKILEKEIEES
jgi:hypothetical protein